MRKIRYSSLLAALLLAFALVFTACGLLDGLSSTTAGGSGEPSNPPPTNPTNPTNPPTTTTPTYDDFNPADYPIINETGRSDSELRGVIDFLHLMFAEKEYEGAWATNYIKTNKIKTIISNGNYGVAWIDPNQLDRIYLGTNRLDSLVDYYNNPTWDDNDRAHRRKGIHDDLTHETMHLVQYSGGSFKLMTGMRPDICAAAQMLTEFLASFYTDGRHEDAYVTADMTDAVATQSKYMILACDPWEYDAARAKDPSLPSYIMSTPWFDSLLSRIARMAFTSALVYESAMTEPLVLANKEDMPRVARSLPACRDPKTVDVTDKALWTVFDALRSAANGDSKYLKLTDDPNNSWRVYRPLFDHFQNSTIAMWDEQYASKARGAY
jgi:hypothetical protein